MTGQGHASRSTSLVTRTRAAIAARGVRRAARDGARELATRVTSSLLYYQLTRGRSTFAFQGQRFRYFYHRYNATWKTERAVEVPIARAALARAHGRRVLEVGNVLSHYGLVMHEVVDKYEHAPRVQNVDIVDFRPGVAYDLIISISTLEHVGWDESPREPAKVLRAIHHLRGLLAPNGTALITLPIAYNTALDDMLRDGRLVLDNAGYLKRISADNRWAEVDWSEIADAQFNTPYRGINGLVVAMLRSSWRR